MSSGPHLREAGAGGAARLGRKSCRSDWGSCGSSAEARQLALRQARTRPLLAGGSMQHRWRPSRWRPSR